jgi:hypothetical protein
MLPNGTSQDAPDGGPSIDITLIERAHWPSNT